MHETGIAVGANIEPVLRVNAVSKAFTGVQALSNVSMNVLPGETHVLLGENGAGKSTLVKAIAGIHSLDAGTMFFQGSEYVPTSPRNANEAGIRMIHQELSVLGSLTVAENIFIEHLPARGGIIDYNTLNENAANLLAQVQLDVAPETLAGNLSIAQQQMVEIARALSGASSLIIMDEPTATLTDYEIDTLFTIIKQLNASGVSIIYISHRLQEIYRIGQHFSVLRNGHLAGSGHLEGCNVDDLVQMMVGRELEKRRAMPVTLEAKPEVLLKVHNLRTQSSRYSVSLTVHAGEILGLAGLVGAGRTEILRAIYGADSIKSGEVFIKGEQVVIRSPREAVQRGLSLVTENRKEEGLMLEQSCAVNITITDLTQISRGMLLERRLEQEAAERAISDLAIRTPSSKTLVQNLSGGNQQKIVLAKWMFRDADLLMVDEPTRGIDVGARQEIYQLLQELAAEGRAILVVSSDLEELMGLCQRIIVLSDGRIAGELEGPDYDEATILKYAFQEHLNQMEVTT